MRKQQALLWCLLAGVFAVATTVLVLSYIATQPGYVMNELGGDCGKNYFTFLYHSVYDKGLWFNGMNYPYGEHIIYADGQPLISTFLNTFTHVTIHQALAVMNLLISFSYVLAILFTYQILRRFGVVPFLAILFACLINLLSPQVLRVRAHFALSYLCFIPMLFYWTIQYYNLRHWRFAVYIFVLGLGMSFIHLYLGAILFLWVGLYALGYFLFDKNTWRNRLRHVLPMLIAAVTLFVIIKVSIAATDPYKDRPAFPLNTLESVTHKRDIFSSPFSPVWKYLSDRKIFTKISDADEGYSYLGITVICILVVSIAGEIAKRARKGVPEAFRISKHVFPPIWLFIALGFLMLAMGAPFIWHMQWLLNYLSLFKQFRAMGRFSWVFYYIAAVYAVVALHAWYARLIASRKPALAYFLLITAFGIWSFEASGIVRYTRGFIAIGRSTYDEFVYKDEMKWPEYLALQHINGSDFQAILLLPLFVSGSEKLWVGGDPSWSMSLGTRASTQLQLPIVDVMMSRTSWNITEKQAKTAAGPYVYKPMLHDLKSNKPILLLQYDQSQPLTEDEKYLLQNSTYIGDHFHLHIYACYPGRIMGSDKKYADNIKATLPYVRRGDTCLGEKGAWYVDHMDSRLAEAHLFGAGATRHMAGDSVVVADIPLKPLTDNQLYEFSCWFLLDSKDYNSPYINIQSFDSAGMRIDAANIFTKESVDNNGLWFRASGYISLKAACHKVKIVVMNETKEPAYKVMDEIMLRPADAVIISKSADGKVMVNNHLFAY
jgi:hypothetical protein